MPRPLFAGVIFLLALLAGTVGGYLKFAVTGRIVGLSWSDIGPIASAASFIVALWLALRVTRSSVSSASRSVP